MKKVSPNALDEFLGAKKAADTAVATTTPTPVATPEPDFLSQINGAMSNASGGLEKVQGILQSVDNILGKLQGFGIGQSRSFERKTADLEANVVRSQPSWEQYAQQQQQQAQLPPPAPAPQEPPKPTVFQKADFAQKVGDLVVTWLVNTYSVMVEQKPTITLAEVYEECKKNKSQLAQVVQRIIMEQIFNGSSQSAPTADNKLSTSAPTQATSSNSSPTTTPVGPSSVTASESQNAASAAQKETPIESQQKLTGSNSSTSSSSSSEAAK